MSTLLPAALRHMTEAGRCPLGTLGSQGGRDKRRCHQGNDHVAILATLGVACQRLRVHLLYPTAVSTVRKSSSFKESRLDQFFGKYEFSHKGFAKLEVYLSIQPGESKASLLPTPKPGSALIPKCHSLCCRQKKKSSHFSLIGLAPALCSQQPPSSAKPLQGELSAEKQLCET